MRMRRWDFVAAYLQGNLGQNEVVYCHAPPGYGTLGADGRPPSYMPRRNAHLRNDPQAGDGSARSSRGSSSSVSLSASPIRACSP
eukprot:5576194-Pleurochrysis_carterae.AAC.1